MRALIVTLLLALAMPGLALQNICPNGNLTMETVDIVEAGQQYTATGCNLYSYVTLYARNLLTATSPTYINLENSVINGTLQLTFLSYSRALVAGPLHVTIQNNVFTRDSLFYMYRYLSTNSTLTIQKNQMSATGATNVAESEYVSIFYIESLSLFSNTTINIVSNTITFDALPNTHIRLMYFNGMSQDSGNSTVNILSNTITSKGTMSGSLIHIDQWSVSENSTLRINSNKLTVTSSQTPVSPFVLNYVYGESSSSLFINSNEVSVSSTETEGYVFSLYDIEYVNVYIENNVVTSGYKYFIYSDNYFWEILYLSIKGNTYTSTIAITTPVIYFYVFRVSDNSTVVLANNLVTAPSVPSSNVLFLEIYSGTLYETTVRYCGNTLPWANSVELDQLFSISFAVQMVYDSTVCSGNNRAPSAVETTSAFFAALVCLLVALVALF